MVRFLVALVAVVSVLGCSDKQDSVSAGDGGAGAPTGSQQSPEELALARAKERAHAQSQDYWGFRGTRGEYPFHYGELETLYFRRGFPGTLEKVSDSELKPVKDARIETPNTPGAWALMFRAVMKSGAVFNVVQPHHPDTTDVLFSETSETILVDHGSIVLPQKNGKGKSVSLRTAWPVAMVEASEDQLAWFKKNIRAYDLVTPLPKREWLEPGEELEISVVVKNGSRHDSFYEEARDEGWKIRLDLENFPFVLERVQIFQDGKLLRQLTEEEEKRYNNMWYGRRGMLDDTKGFDPDQTTAVVKLSSLSNYSGSHNYSRVNVLPDPDNLFIGGYGLWAGYVGEEGTWDLSKAYYYTRHVWKEVYGVHEGRVELSRDLTVWFVKKGEEATVGDKQQALGRYGYAEWGGQSDYEYYTRMPRLEMSWEEIYQKIKELKGANQE